jgi:hypothetical protein
VQLQGNPVGEVLNNTEWAFPLAEVFHIVGFGIAIGTVVLVDLRLMGAGLKRHPARYLIQQTWVWTLVALVVVIFSGIAIFLSDPVMYLHNESFRFKLTMLGLAILYNYTIHHQVAASGREGVLARLAGMLSMALWLSVVAGGIFIAFV